MMKEEINEKQNKEEEEKEEASASDIRCSLLFRYVQALLLCFLDTFAHTFLGMLSGGSARGGGRQCWAGGRTHQGGLIRVEFHQ